MVISPEALQAALDAYMDNGEKRKLSSVYCSYDSMQAALAAAFPIMLREVAKRYATSCPSGHGDDYHTGLMRLADSFSGKDKP